MFNPRKPLCITDIETGGLELSHPIIQIAAIAVIPESGEILDEFEMKLRFEPDECQQAALTINKYEEAAWAQAEAPARVLKNLAMFYSKHAYASRVSKKGGSYKVAIGGGYNSHFDTDRIFHRAKEHGQFLPVDPRFLDVMQLAMWKLDLPSYKLTPVAEYLGVEVKDAHDALGDVKMTALVMRNLLAY